MLTLIFAEIQMPQWRGGPRISQGGEGFHVGKWVSQVGPAGKQTHEKAEDDKNRRVGRGRFRTQKEPLARGLSMGPGVWGGMTGGASVLPCPVVGRGRGLGPGRGKRTACQRECARGPKAHQEPPPFQVVRGGRQPFPPLAPGGQQGWAATRRSARSSSGSAWHSTRGPTLRRQRRGSSLDCSSRMGWTTTPTLPSLQGGSPCPWRVPGD